MNFPEFVDTRTQKPYTTGDRHPPEEISITNFVRKNIK